MPQVPLQVIRELVPPTLTLVEHDAPDRPVVADRMGGQEVVCGRYVAVLMTGVQNGTVFGLVVRCAACDALNATEPA